VALDRDRIVRAALDLLDEVGLEGLTLRALAGRLDVKAPALYWHVASKSALLDEMATTMLRDLLAGSPPPDDSTDWRQFITMTSHGLHGMMLAHRDGARVFSGTLLTADDAVAASEIPMRILTREGFSLRDAVGAWQTAYAFVVGFTIEEQAVEPRAGQRDPRFDAGRRADRLDPASTPLTHQASRLMFDDAAGRFAFGLEVILDGLAARLARSTG